MFFWIKPCFFKRRKKFRFIIFSIYLNWSSRICESCIDWFHLNFFVKIPPFFFISLSLHSSEKCIPFMSWLCYYIRRNKNFWSYRIFSESFINENLFFYIVFLIFFFLNPSSLNLCIFSFFDSYWTQRTIMIHDSFFCFPSSGTIWTHIFFWSRCWIYCMSLKNNWFCCNFCHILKLFWKDIEQVFDSSSLLFCLHVDEQSGCWIEIKFSYSEMMIWFTENLEVDSFFSEKVCWPFSIAFSFLSSLLSIHLIECSIWPFSVLIDSSVDQVLCCLSHRWKNYSDIKSADFRLLSHARNILKLK